MKRRDAIHQRLTAASQKHQHAGSRYLTCATCEAELDVGGNAKRDGKWLLACAEQLALALQPFVTVYGLDGSTVLVVADSDVHSAQEALIAWAEDEA